MRSKRASGMLVPAAAFAATFATAVVAGDQASRRLPVEGDRREQLVAGERPDDGDHYLANDIAGHVDHHVLYFGTDPDALARLRAADVLFLGNSRLMFALRPRVLRPFFEAQGLNYYVLGFGYREADRFPLAIIRKFDLRPKLVVVNADGFFANRLSDWAEVVNRDTPFAARKLQIEAELGHEFRRSMHAVLPHWLELYGRPGLRTLRTFTAYRSRFDGTWIISPWRAGTTAFPPFPLDGPRAGRDELAAARAFKADMDARGSRLVLTRVPTPEPMPGGGPAVFADYLGVPLVTADIAGPSSHDDSHLDRASAIDWSRAFVRALAPFLRNVTASHDTAE
ncbi:MAG: hypothetical protein R2745_03860 [Vicinamibacterales bacterium]